MQDVNLLLNYVTDILAEVTPSTFKAMYCSANIFRCFGNGLAPFVALRFISNQIGVLYRYRQ